MLRELARAGDRVIAFAGEDGEAFAADADFDGVIVLGTIVAARIVANGVLIAGLFDAGIHARGSRHGVENVPHRCRARRIAGG